jgi:hypothetical protein
VPSRKPAKVIEEFADIVDHIQEHRNSITLLTEQKDSLEWELRKIAEETGLDDFKTDRITIKVGEKVVARYEPDKWHEVVKWCLDNDLLDVLQRRLTASKLQSLAEDGVALPDGIWLESIDNVSFRRNK